jgi:hypothetical protein
VTDTVLVRLPPETPVLSNDEAAKVGRWFDSSRLVVPGELQFGNCCFLRSAAFGAKFGLRVSDGEYVMGLEIFGRRSS